MTLRIVRIATSFLVFVLFLLAFIAGEQIASSLAHALSFFQFTPSLLKFLLVAGGLGSVGFIIIILLTLLFGRIYCSFLCPLGILQDMINFFSKKILKQAHQYHKPKKRTRYGIFIITLILSLAGILTILNFLDPYSFFGRIAANFFGPTVVSLNNITTPVLESFDIYTLSTLKTHKIAFIILAADLALLGLLFIMAIFQGRLFCNSICPIGTFLGIISHHAVFKITLQSDKCTMCGICEVQCRASCIDYQHAHIDLSRCVMCCDCIDFCPESGISFEYVSRKRSPLDLNKRNFILGATSTFSSIFLIGGPVRSAIKHLIPANKRFPITPPGSINLEQFMNTCTACYQCVSNCPTHVITPSLTRYGLRGILQPSLDFTYSYCAYECNTCSQVCPTGAIQSIPKEDKQLIQIGIARLDMKECVVEVKKKECGACAEVCPTHAVYTIEQNNLLYPKTDPDLCIGCGHCELACPTSPKAIVVDASTIHGKAKAPFYNQAAPKKKIESEDFPF